MIVPGKVCAALEKAEAPGTDESEQVPVPSQEPFPVTTVTVGFCTVLRLESHHMLGLTTLTSKGFRKDSLK